MNKLIIQTLAPLKIPTAFMEYSGKASAYILFQVYDSKDYDYMDDEATAEVNYVSLTFWYTNSADADKAKEIKRLMKANGFIFDGSKDMKYNEKYGKNFDFIYKEYL